MLKSDNGQEQRDTSPISPAANTFQYPTLPSTQKLVAKPVAKPPSNDAATNVQAQAVAHHLEEEQNMRDFTAKKEKIIGFLSDSQSLLSSLISPELDQWTTLYPVFDAQRALKTVSEPHTFKVITLNMRSPGRSFGQEMLHSLDEKSISQLLRNRIKDCVRHIGRITQRVSDTSSKVLVTGDLNSGKSTLINSLLRRDVLPYDQQPCTTMFCEVSSAFANGGIEEVHGVPDPAAYNTKRSETFSRFDTAHIKQALTTEESSQYQLWKVYCDDRREDGSSLLHSGAIDMVLIDSPGLNRDFTQTMAVFAQHEEIDAVIFVVNSENHFTLSGVEFLGEAKREKPHMFIVANRFDVISDKERCRQNIMKQLKELLPETEQHAQELVHFVSARDFMSKAVTRQSGVADDNPSELDFSFANLEACLRSFLLEKRTRTKLAPAKIYLENLMRDIYALSAHNELVAKEQNLEAQLELEVISPLHSQTVDFYASYNEHVERKIGENMHLIHINGQQMMDSFLQSMSADGDKRQLKEEVQYGGIFRIWSYAEALVRHANLKLGREMAKFETDSGRIVSDAVYSLYQHVERSVPDWEKTAGSVETYVSSNFVNTEIDIREPQIIKVTVEFQDFFALPPHAVAIGASVFGAATIGAGYIGFGRVASGISQVGSLVGLNSIAKIAGASAFILSAGTLTILLTEARSTVEGRVAKKIKRQIRKSERVQRRIHKVGYESRKALEKASFELKKNIANIMEQQESLCKMHESSKIVSGKCVNYFGKVKRESRGLLELLQQMNVDSL